MVDLIISLIVSFILTPMVASKTLDVLRTYWISIGYNVENISNTYNICLAVIGILITFIIYGAIWLIKITYRKFQ